MRRLGIVPALLALAGCAVGPNYVAPKPLPATQTPFVEAKGTALLGDRPLPAKWWELFADPALDRLIADAFAHNTSIATAEANLRRARGVLSEQRTGLLPTTTVSGAYTHARIGTYSLGANGVATGGAAAPSGFTYDLYQAGFDASYEVDLFGRVRRSIQAARRDAEASEAALDGVRISIAAQVAQAYAAACANAEQADVARETARLQGNTLDLTRRLLDAGRGTQRDVDQAAVIVEQANASVPALEGERRANIYAIAALTGHPPAETDAAVAQCRLTPHVRTPIPVGDGATLLARRPDVRQAERTLAADTARIGIATAALFPRISLAGQAGLAAPRPGDLGNARAFSFSVGPLLSWSFPNIAAARAQIRQARAGADASLSTFEGAILTALQETESALARYTAALDRKAALARAVTASEDAARLSRLRFQSGRDNFLNLLVAEQNRAQTRAALADADATVAQQAVSLFKALGGGWEEAPPTAAARPAAMGDGRSPARPSLAPAGAAPPRP